MALTSAQWRAIELNLEQMERFHSLEKNRPGITITAIVNEFYDTDTRGSKFEMDILRKIGALLAPDSTEPFTYGVIVNIPR